MHQEAGGGAESLSDSMQMFKWGVEGGRPRRRCARRATRVVLQGRRRLRRRLRPGAALALLSRSTAAKSRRSSASIVIAPDGTPQRLGFAIGNEFSDHVTERKNYLYLAHSKLRPCAIGPELRTGAPPAHMEGVSRIRARRSDRVGAAVPHRRNQHVPLAGQSRVPPFQVRRRTAGRATCICISSAPRR